MSITKVVGISGNKEDYNFGDIGDLAMAVNRWLENNRDISIKDIKIMPVVIGESFCRYDALVTYEREEQ